MGVDAVADGLRKERDAGGCRRAVTVEVEVVEEEKAMVKPWAVAASGKRVPKEIWIPKSCVQSPPELDNEWLALKK